MKIRNFLLLSITIITLIACNNDDTPSNNAPTLENVELTISENPRGDLITTMVGNDIDNDVLSYSVEMQTPNGSISIEETTGNINVANREAFIFDNNTKIEATVKVSDGKADATATLIINITSND